MRIFAITRSGLIGISICVLALWSCIGTELHYRRQAQRDQLAMSRADDLVRPVAHPAPVRRPLKPLAS